MMCLHSAGNEQFKEAVLSELSELRALDSLRAKLLIVCRATQRVGVFLLTLTLSFELVAQPLIELPKSGLEPHQLAVIYLRDDVRSKAIADYYRKARAIPKENVFAVAFDSSKKQIEPGHFAVQFAALSAKLDENVQAFALAWDQPYQVGCMSLSAAFAFGYNVDYCADSCKKTRISSYFHTLSATPWDDFGMRPTMMLAAGDLEQNVRLIERGKLADASLTRGKVILLDTSDRRRSVRSRFFSEIERDFQQVSDVYRFNSDSVSGLENILLYVAGTKRVEDLDTIGFMPGALADHLTSAGGKLTDSRQMSAVEWLRAGATASYGTAIEPCNLTEKFPNPVIQLWHYLRGTTALEAYWKSVRMPGQGNFIGEPLAAPYRGYKLKRVPNGWEIHSPVIFQGRYKIFSGELGAERYVETRTVSKYKPLITLHEPLSTSYRIERIY